MEAREGTPHRKLNLSSQVPIYHSNLCTIPRHFYSRETPPSPWSVLTHPALRSRGVCHVQPSQLPTLRKSERKNSAPQQTALTLERTNTLAQVLTCSVHRAITFPLIIITITITYNRSRRLLVCNPKPPKKTTAADQIFRISEAFCVSALVRVTFFLGRELARGSRRFCSCFILYDFVGFH